MRSSVRERYLALLSEAFAEPAQLRAVPRVPFRSSSAGVPPAARVDADDSARILAGFHGLPLPATPSLHYVRSSADGQASAYAWDEETGMVYILD